MTREDILKTVKMVRTADGRFGWPSVVQYQLAAGPHEGTLLTCPPTRDAWPDPESAKPPPIDSFAAASKWAAWMARQALGENMARCGLSYFVKVHDLAIYNQMSRLGMLRDPLHAGPKGKATDSRKIS